MRQFLGQLFRKLVRIRLGNYRPELTIGAETFEVYMGLVCSRTFSVSTNTGLGQVIELDAVEEELRAFTPSLSILTKVQLDIFSSF